MHLSGGIHVEEISLVQRQVANVQFVNHINALEHSV